jgi:hypothetical protein
MLLIQRSFSYKRMEFEKQQAQIDAQRDADTPVP